MRIKSGKFCISIQTGNKQNCRRRRWARVWVCMWVLLYKQTSFKLAASSCPGLLVLGLQGCTTTSSSFRFRKGFREMQTLGKERSVLFLQVPPSKHSLRVCGPFKGQLWGIALTRQKGEWAEAAATLVPRWLSHYVSFQSNSLFTEFWSLIS